MSAQEGPHYSPAPGSVISAGPNDVVVLHAADLLPERQKCIREQDEALAKEAQDTRFCRECQQKPCRWWNGWRPAQPRVAPPQECGACGMKHYPDEPGFTPQDCPGWQPPIPDVVATEIERACNADPTDKTQDHFRSRRKLFEAVDRQIRAVVKSRLPEITVEFKEELDQEMGLAALRKRVQQVNASISADLDAAVKRFESRLDKRVEDLLLSLQEEASSEVMKAFAQSLTRIVAEEVGQQITTLLMNAPKKKKRITLRVRKKRSRAP